MSTTLCIDIYKHKRNHGYLAVVMQLLIECGHMLEDEDICISRELVEHQAFPLSILNSQDPKGKHK